MTYYQQPQHHYPPPYQEFQENPGTGLGIAAFVCSLILWPVGLILAIMSWHRSREAGRRMTGLTIAAIVLSSVAALFSLLLFGAAALFHFGTTGAVTVDPPAVTQIITQ